MPYVVCYAILYTHTLDVVIMLNKKYIFSASYIVYLYPVKRAKAMSVQHTVCPSHSDLNEQLKNGINLTLR